MESVVHLHPSPVKTSAPVADTQPTEPESAQPGDDQPLASDEEEEKQETEEPVESAEAGKQSSPAASEEQLREDEKEPAEATGEAEVIEDGLEMEKGEEKRGEEGATESAGVVPVQEESVVIVDTEDSGTELTKILLEAFQRYKVQSF